MGLLKFDTPDGEILIEVDDEADVVSGVREKGAAADAAERALDPEAFDTAIGRIRAIGNAVARTVRDIDLTPETAEVELALKFTGSAGVVFAKAGAEAQMKVRLSRKPGSAGGDGRDPS